MKEPATLESMFMGDGFNGDGTFRFAEPEKVPDTYESTHQIIFTPNDTETYDYSGVPGWSAEGQQVVRSVTVYVESLKAPEPSAEEKEEPKKEEAEQRNPSRIRTAARLTRLRSLQMTRIRMPIRKTQTRRKSP